MGNSFDMKSRPPPIPPQAMREPALPDAALPRAGEIVAAKYRIERLLGRGGMGAVFEASHVLSGKRVALKWMLPQARDAGLAERFLHEARATARIDHPNVVDIYDVGRKDDSAYLVMELLHGESLATRLQRAPLSPRQAVAVLMPALRGVAAAHAQGVVHRDLKPDNIFLCIGPEGETRDCKVLDFGISKIAEDRELSQTKSGTVMGTPYYMSPEQIRGLSEVDHRGDVYAFGVILYEMLAQCYPFDADTYNELVVKIATTDPVPLHRLRPELEPELCAIVMKAMARDRRARFQSVAALAEALQPYADGVRFRVSLVPPSQAMASPSLQPVETMRCERPGMFSAWSARVMLFAALGLLTGSGALLISGPEVLIGEQGGRIADSVRRAPAAEPMFIAHIDEARIAEPSEPAAAGTVEEAAARPHDELEARAVVARAVRGSGGAGGGAATKRKARPTPKAQRVEARPAAVRVQPAPSAGALPADWDERLVTPTSPAPERGAVVGERGAGKLSAGDL